jgi:hypothetical protein
MLMDDLRGRLANRVQLTTDGHRAYLQAVEEAFGADVDYGMLMKLYGVETGGWRALAHNHGRNLLGGVMVTVMLYAMVLAALAS